VESFSGQHRPTFALLRQRLVDAVNTRVNNGEFSERALARILGISQPQMNNVLKGARKLTPETADIIFERLNMSVLDLLTASDISHLIAKLSPSEAPTASHRTPAVDCQRKPVVSASRVAGFDKVRAS
jgi:predicted XRE-type DNA-binding protein